MFESTTRTVDDIVRGVQRQFGDEAETQLKVSDVIRWVNNGQRDIVTNNTELNAVKATTPIVVGQQEYPLLSDPAFEGMLRIRSIHHNGVRLKALTFQEAEDLQAHVNEFNRGGNPTSWFVYSGTIYLHPVPQTASEQPLTIFFTKAPERVTSRTDLLGVPDNYYNALEDYVLSKAFEMDENGQMSQMKTQQYEKSLGIQQNQTVEQSNTFATIRILPEDWGY